MSRFLDPTGKPTFGIGICDRSGKKVFLSELYPDPNSPGIRCVKEWLDQYDPYRLAPRQPDKIDLPFTRPDVSIATRPAGAIQERGEEFFVTEDNNKYLEF